MYAQLPSSHLQPVGSLEVMTGAKQHILFHRVVLSWKAPRPPQASEGNRTQGGLNQEASRSSCSFLPLASLALSERWQLADSGWVVWEPPGPNFKVVCYNNNPLTCVLCTQSFHYIASSPSKSSCLRSSRCGSAGHEPD